MRMGEKGGGLETGGHLAKRPRRGEDGVGGWNTIPRSN